MWEYRLIGDSCFLCKSFTVKGVIGRKKSSANHGAHRFRQAATVVLATCRQQSDEQVQGTCTSKKV